MKITGLELCHIAVPFAKPYALSKRYGTLTHAHAVIFKVHTDAGLTGVGEADPMNPFTDETPGTVLAVGRDLIGPRLLGLDPTRVAGVEAELDGAVAGNPTARGAVSMALFDLAGKTWGVPAHALLGGRLRDELPVLWPIGSGTPAEDAAAIEAASGQGYRTVMIKMGALPVEDEIGRMRAARKRFDGRVAFIADANQGWKAAEALRFVVGVGEDGPALLEQPVDKADWEGLRRVRERAPFPVSADEAVVTVGDAAGLARAGLADVFSLKISKNGGLARARQIAEVAHAFGISCLMNSMLEFGVTQAASLQLGCTLPNLVDLGHAYMSVLRLADDVTDFRANLSRGVARVPLRPGLGVEVDEDKLQAYTVSRVAVGQSS